VKCFVVGQKVEKMMRSEVVSGKLISMNVAFPGSRIGGRKEKKGSFKTGKLRSARHHSVG
jgi:hypothetical protein